VKASEDQAGVRNMTFFLHLPPVTGSQQAFQCMCNVFTQSAARKLLQGSIGNLSQDCLWPIAQNANDYQVLDSTFCRFDCDCFIHSMHSSTVPFGCASCHFSTRCCCNKKQVFYHGFSGSRISLIWGKGQSHSVPIFLSVDLLT
jgi:hypothetical protein